MNSVALEWAKVLGPLIISWPFVLIVALLIFRKPLLSFARDFADRFSESRHSRFKVGQLELELEVGGGEPLKVPVEHKESRNAATFRLNPRDLLSEVDKRLQYLQSTEYKMEMTNNDERPEYKLIQRQVALWGGLSAALEAIIRDGAQTNAEQLVGPERRDGIS